MLTGQFFAIHFPIYFSCDPNHHFHLSVCWIAANRLKFCKTPNKSRKYKVNKIKNKVLSNYINQHQVWTRQLLLYHIDTVISLFLDTQVWSCVTSIGRMLDVIVENIGKGKDLFSAAALKRAASYRLATKSCFSCQLRIAKIHGEKICQAWRTVLYIRTKRFKFRRHLTRLWVSCSANVAMNAVTHQLSQSSF